MEGMWAMTEIGLRGQKKGAGSAGAGREDEEPVWAISVGSRCPVSRYLSLKFRGWFGAVKTNVVLVGAEVMFKVLSDGADNACGSWVWSKGMWRGGREAQSGSSLGATGTWTCGEWAFLLQEMA